MEKIGLLKNEKMGNYELKKGFASYKTLVNYFIGDIVLCNNIQDIDFNFWENIECEDFYNEETGEQKEIYQFFLCNVSDFQKEQAKKAGLILSYSDMLECDVLLVDHWGTSWDYVLTNVKLFDNYEELKAYEEGND